MGFFFYSLFLKETTWELCLLVKFHGLRLSVACIIAKSSTTLMVNAFSFLFVAASQWGIVTKKKKKKGKIQCTQEKIGQLEEAIGVVYLGEKRKS